MLERRVLRRNAFERWAGEQLPRCTVAMEACASSHHWGRWFSARGHCAKLSPAQFVVAFRKGGKNDGADAEAIALEAGQPTMRFVLIKTAEQQSILAWHAVREGRTNRTDKPCAWVVRGIWRCHPSPCRSTGGSSSET